MKPMKKTMFISIVPVLLAVSVAPASAETFNASAIKLENIVGRVIITTGNTSNIEVNIDPGARIVDVPPTRVVNGVLRIGSSKEIETRKCNVKGSRSANQYGEHYQVRIKLPGGKLRPLSDYPTIRVSVPTGTDLTLAGGTVFGTAGDMGEVDLLVDGCGKFIVGDVADNLKARINGSGDIVAGTVGGALQSLINGSGDIIIGAVLGDASLRINGSGDIEVDRVRSVVAKINGSGDIEVGSVSGEVETCVNGSGDIEIAGGTAAPFVASIHGSGDIAFGGHANGVRVYIAGSGDIVVNSFEGDLDTDGHRIEVNIDGGRLHVEG